MRYQDSEGMMDKLKDKSVKLGKDKSAKAGDGAPLQAGESSISGNHWGKIATKCGGEAKLLAKLGMTDKRGKP